MVTTHSTWFSPSARVWVSSCSVPDVGPCIALRTTTLHGSAVSRLARKTTVARSGEASRHSTRRSLMRTGPVSSMRTGRHRPPGFQVSSRQSQCWKTPVRLRLEVLSPCGEHVTSMARTCSLAAASCSVTSKVWGAK